MKTLERYEQRKFETVCFSIRNNVMLLWTFEKSISGTEIMEHEVQIFDLLNMLLWFRPLQLIDGVDHQKFSTSLQISYGQRLYTLMSILVIRSHAQFPVST